MIENKRKISGSSVRWLGTFIFLALFIIFFTAFVVKADDSVEVKKIDGSLCVFVNGEVDPDYTGLAEYQDELWYFEDGKIDYYTYEIYSDESGEWFVLGGQVQSDYDDIIYLNNNGDQDWWLIEDGKVSYENTIAENKWGSWYVKNGKIDSDAYGIYSDENGDWFVSGGKVETDCNDLLYLNNNGDIGWWLIRNGKVSYEDAFIENSFGYWYVKNGKADSDATGIYSDENGDWYVKNGKIQTGCNDIVYLNNNGDEGWWLIRNGKVSYESIVAEKSDGWWYCEKGKINFDACGIFPNENGDWYVKDGKVQFGVNDILYLDNYGRGGESGWWLLRDGRVSYVDTVAQNENGWWRVENGKVNFNFYGAASNESGLWYIQEGMVWFVTGRKTFELNGQTVTRYVYNGLVLDDNDPTAEVLRAADNILDNECGRDLYSAYRWSVEKLTYTHETQGNRTVANAMYAYNYRHCDCRGFASSFCWLARALGYECNVLLGEVPYAAGGFGVHAWCEIYVDGKYYWVDPQYVNQDGNNTYLFNYGQAGTWVYRNWSIMSEY